AGTRGGIVAAGGVSPSGVHSAGRTPRLGGRQRAADLRAVVRRGFRSGARVGGRSKASGGAGWADGGAAHLGTNLAFAPPLAPHGDGGRAVVQSSRRGRCLAALAVLSAGLLLAGETAQPVVQRQIPGGTARGLGREQSNLAPDAARWASAASVAGEAATARLGGLQQTADRRSGSGAEVPGAVHLPRGDEQQPLGSRRRRHGDLPVERLPRRRPAERDDPA